MPNYQTPAQRARQFASSVTLMIREVLDRLPEREMICFLDELHGRLTTELFAQRMELESVGSPAHIGDEAEV
jgi:hypothetical protein